MARTLLEQRQQALLYHRYLLFREAVAAITEADLTSSETTATYGR